MANKRLPFLRVFSSTIVLDQPFAGMGEHTVTGAINFTADVTDAEEGYTTGCVLVADGVNTPTFTGIARGGSTVYDNTVGKRNQILFYYLGGQACYAVSVINASVGLTTLNTPGSFNATAIDDTEIDLTWTDTNSSPNESGYTIYWNGINDFGSAAVLATPTAGATSYNHTGLSPSSSFYYWIKANGNGTTTADSATVSDSATTMAGSGDDADAADYFARLAALPTPFVPSSGRHTLINDLIVAGKTGSDAWWDDLLDAGFLCLGTDPDTREVTLKGDKTVNIVSGTFVYDDTGMECDGSGAVRVDTNIVPNTDFASQDSVAIGFVNNTAGTPTTPFQSAMGLQDDTQNLGVTFTDGNQLLTAANNAPNETLSTSHTRITGLYTLKRTSSANYKVRVNGTTIHTQSTASVGRSTVAIGLFSLKNQFSTNYNPYIGKLCFWFAFKVGITDAQGNKFVTDVKACLDGMGITVIP